MLFWKEEVGKGVCMFTYVALGGGGGVGKGVCMFTLKGLSTFSHN